MPDSHGLTYLVDALIMLAAAVAIVSAFARVRISPVLGYIVAGALIGPNGFSVIPDPDQVALLGELGVMFLLFTIGLELSVQRLWAMRRYVFGLGSLQVLVTGSVIAVLAAAAGAATDAAIVIGAGLALSSTAIVIRMLVDRGEHTGHVGRGSISILLFQDLAVVPLLVMVPLLGDDSGTLWSDLGWAMVRAVAAVAMIIVIGRLILRPAFHVIARGTNADVVLAAALLVILGTALATYYAGLSLALGAFLAGLLVAETEYRHQIEADVTPFRAILLALFFMSIGMSVDLGVVAAEILPIVAIVLGLLLTKAVIITGLARLFSLPLDMALRIGLLLAQGGEFGLLLFDLAAGQGVLGERTAQLLLAVVTLTMAVTPMLAVAGLAAARRVGRTDEGMAGLAHETADLSDHVVIAGFGRVGQTIGRMLSAQKVHWVALDLDAHRVREGRAAGLPVFYGDASRPKVLEAAGASRARAAAITLNDPAAALRAVVSLHHAHPSLEILVRARDDSATEALEAQGASVVVPETLEASLQLGGQVLRRAGAAEHDVARVIGDFRGEGYAEAMEIIKAAGSGDRPSDSEPPSRS